MGKRKRLKKNPAPEPENNNDDGEDIISQVLSKSEIPTENNGDPEGFLEEVSAENLRTPTTSETHSDDGVPSTDIPKQWTEVPILELAKQGWTYRSRPADTKGGKYMYIRNRETERSLGRWSPELEQLLFERYPILYKPKGVEAEPPPSSGRSLGSKPFFNVPIKRIAVIPGDYRPTMDVIRYYHIYKNNGFLGDFSDFMNGIIATHFMKCHGVFLPVYVNEELIEQHA